MCMRDTNEGCILLERMAKVATNTVITRGIATEAEVKAFMRQAEDS